MGNFITQITFLEGSSSSLSPQEGYTKVAQDLNEGAGGKYIYLCYSKNDLYPPITGLFLTDSQNEQPPSGYYKYPIDLNAGAGGKWIFLCSTTAPEAGAPITDITFVKGENAPAPTGYIRLDLDLNRGAGGRYIYLCYKR